MPVPVPPDTEERPNDPIPRGRRDAGRAALAVVVVLAALSVAWVTVSFVTGPSEASGLPSAPEEHLRGAPALRIHPQRARAGLPLPVEVWGSGCPGTSGVLTVTEAGSADGDDGADRLVVRRRLDIAADRTFRSTPVLVGQPPGTYRISVACDRRRTAPEPGARSGRDETASDETAPGEVGRDVFEVTELLELTGPGAAREFTVSPLGGEPGTTTTFTFNGAGCLGAGARVEVGVFPPSAMAPGPMAVSTPPVVDGAWRGSVTVPAEAATGTYAFEASCTTADGRRFAYVSRHVHFGPVTFAVEPQTSTWDDLLDDLGIRLKPAAPAVEATDRPAGG